MSASGPNGQILTKNVQTYESEAPVDPVHRRRSQRHVRDVENVTDDEEADDDAGRSQEEIDKILVRDLIPERTCDGPFVPLSVEELKFIVYAHRIGWKLSVNLLNPKSKGSKSFQRYELYKNASTVSEFLRAGGTMSDLKHDYAKCFIKFDRDSPATVGAMRSSLSHYVLRRYISLRFS